MNFWNVNIVGIIQELQSEFSITVPSVTLPMSLDFHSQETTEFALVGIFSSNFGKPMQCKNCGYKWRYN